MKILLDTSYIIWIFSEPKKIAERIARELNTGNVYFSSISLIEIAIKRSLNKLAMPKTSFQIYEMALKSDFIYLSFEPQDALRFEKLPVLHGDPFDRMIIAQAMHHNMAIATTDRQFEQYNVKVIS